MRLAFVEAAKAVRSQRLHNADVNKRIVMAHEFISPKVYKAGEAVQIGVQEMLAQVRRQVRFCVEQQGGDVIVQRAFSPALIIQEKGLAITQHYVARLKITIEKVIARRGQQEAGKPAKIDFQLLFAERNIRQFQKVILEVVQVPGNGLTVKARTGIADLVVQIVTSFHLEARQLFCHLAVNLYYGRINLVAAAVGGKKLEERGATQIFFQIGSSVEVCAVDLGHGQTVAAKVPGKFQERDVFSTDVIEDSDRAGITAGQANDSSA